MHVEYMTTAQAAEKWKISDRRVRILCRDGRIPGVQRAGKSYRIPVNAVKPIDGRFVQSEHAFLYLKWRDDVIGLIDEAYNVTFVQPRYNTVVTLYTRGKNTWSHDEFVSFLSDRVVSRDRRDIEKILFRCGLSAYDVIRIAEVTRGIHPKDLLWIAKRPEESFYDVMTAVFESVFLQKIDLVGDSVDTPEGFNIKRYGVWNGKYGIYKQRISPLVKDVESEIAVFNLSGLFGVPCCPAYRTDADTVFSEFLYDFSSEYIVHFRRLFDGARSENEYKNLISVRPQYKTDIIRMLLFDFITRQDDRHLSNIAIKVTSNGESFYPLYDNGRSLFYEDTAETALRAWQDVDAYATVFGIAGTYLDHLRDISASGVKLTDLICLDVSEQQIEEALASAGFEDYRLEGSRRWIRAAIETIRSLG